MIYRDWILVGVDGSDGSAAAVMYAAREARRRDVGLRLVHVAPTRVELTPVYPGFELSEAGIAAAAGEILARSAALALDHVAAWGLSTAALAGERADVLGAEAQRAVVVVLGDESRGSCDGSASGSTCDGVIARSTAPVVLVPAAWSSASERGAVVAGVPNLDGSRDLIRIAVEEAHRRAAPLCLIHACEAPGAEGAATAAAARRLLQEAADRVGAEFPRVRIDVRVVSGSSLDALRAAAADAALLIVHRSGDEASSATLRALRQWVTCPIEIVSSALGVHAPDQNQSGIREAPAPRSS